MDPNLHRTEPQRDFFPQDFSIDNVTPFHRDDFVSGDMGNRKQTTPMNLALMHFRFWREVGEPHHRNRIVVATLVPRALASIAYFEHAPRLTQPPLQRCVDAPVS